MRRGGLRTPLGRGIDALAPAADEASRWRLQAYDAGQVTCAYAIGLIARRYEQRSSTARPLFR